MSENSSSNIKLPRRHERDRVGEVIQEDLQDFIEGTFQSSNGSRA